MQWLREEPLDVHKIQSINQAVVNKCIYVLSNSILGGREFISNMLISLENHEMETPLVLTH